MLWRIGVVVAVVIAGVRAAAGVPLTVQTFEGVIAVDGSLGDRGWSGATTVDTFYEYVRTDNEEPPAKTVATLTWDARSLYVGFKAYDPDPLRIRAPFVDRDQVSDDQDWVGIMLDTQNDRRSAVVFRVNPRGIQFDGMRNDANGDLDASPDFFFDASASITEFGWAAELRIPLSSLRYPDRPSQSWGVILQRNYPRDFGYVMANVEVPKGSNCLVCLAATLDGLDDLPSGDHLTVAPYATTASTEQLTDPGRLTSGLGRSSVSGEFGVDVKWQPSPRLAIDATVNPDFSQIESDVAEITVNNRFAIAYPEKRTFFLEGVDLLSTPLDAVHTRTITSPAWGARATGQTGSTAWTFLAAKDRGGGAVVLPGPLGSEFAHQDFESTAIIGRSRTSIGKSFVGFLVTAREIDGGGYNRVAGPDFLWRPTDADRITGQALMSWTENPSRTDLSSRLDGSAFSSHAIRLSWNHDVHRYNSWFIVRDVGDRFRADNGFIPQVGYRAVDTGMGLNFYPERSISYANPWIGAWIVEDQAGEAIRENPYLGLYFQGRWGSSGWVSLNSVSERVGSAMLDSRHAGFSTTIRPSRRLPIITLAGTLGDRVDYANERVGTGGSLDIDAAVRPTDHLELRLLSRRQWLDVDGGRLFTAEIERLKASYTISARSFARIIGQWSDIERDPALYHHEVAPKDGGFSISALYGWRLNWQTVFFVGYGDSHAFDQSRDSYAITDRQAFAKVSYAWQW